MLCRVQSLTGREREREGERVEGEGGGRLQTDNTLNHRWLSKVARE